MLLGRQSAVATTKVARGHGDEVEAALPGSRTTTAAGTPGLDLRAGIAGQLRDLGVTSMISIRAARWPIRRCSVIAAVLRPGASPRWSGWSERHGGGAPALQNGENGGNQRNRESELTHALAAVRSRLAIAAQASARNVGEIELLPITKFFSGN